MKHSIEDLIEKIKGFWQKQIPQPRAIPDDLFLGLIIIFVAFGSFGLGRLSKIEGSKTPIHIENAPQVTDQTFISKPGTTASGNKKVGMMSATEAELVGSKNGTKYYYSWCSGAQKISPANLIHFTSKADAESRGYTPSATCKGL